MTNILLESCAKLNTDDINGNLPLHLAAEAGCTDVIDDLPCSQYTINKKNKYGLTPLHLAVQNKQEEAIEMLMLFGADPDIQDEEGNTALMIEAKVDCIQIAELLLGGGADRTKENKAKETFDTIIRSQEMKDLANKYNTAPDVSLNDILKVNTKGLQIMLFVHQSVGKSSIKQKYLPT